MSTNKDIEKKDSTSPEAVKALRSKLVKCSFDPSLLVDEYFQAVNGSSGDAISSKIESPELYLLESFDKLIGGLSSIAKEMQVNISTLQRQASDADYKLVNELDKHTNKLSAIQVAVNQTQQNFAKASDNAMNIGTRLTIADTEKNKLDKGIEMLEYIQFFEDTGAQMQNMDQILSKSIQQLRAHLPPALKDSEIYSLCSVLHDLRSILYDINCEEVQHAQNYVLRLSEAVENDLLQEFGEEFKNMMNSITSQSNTSSVRDKQVKQLQKCRLLVKCLHCFHNGSSVQKKYIFSVIEERLPINTSDKSLNVANFKTESTILFVPIATWKRLAKVVKRTGNEDAFDAADDNSSAGATDSNASDDEEDEQEMEHTDSFATSTPLNQLDQLSQLFSIIGSVCQEQFTIIRMIFPATVAVKITRTLIQRIFCDPLFGIQKRVDSALETASKSNNLSEYIDTLVLIKQKMSGLFFLLLDYSVNPMFIEQSEQQRSASIDQSYEPIHDDEEDERLKSEADMKDFLQDQISQVLSSYITDYFDSKELLHIKKLFVEDLRIALSNVNDANLNSLIQTSTVLTLPKLKAEKIKSIPILLKSVANKAFINKIFERVSDSMDRLAIIEQDETKLALYYRELFILFLNYLVENIVLPWCQCCTILFLKYSSSTSNTNSVANLANINNNIMAVAAATAGGANSNLPSLPPLEYFELLVVIYHTIHRLQTFFQDKLNSIMKKSVHGMNPMSTNILTNMLSISKETKRKSLVVLEKVLKESLHAWILAVGNYVDKVLQQVQLKSDFSNAFLSDLSNTANTLMNDLKADAAALRSNGKNIENIFFTAAGTKGEAAAVGLHGSKHSSASSSSSSTAACDFLCKALLSISNAIHSHAQGLALMNMRDNIWVPLGRQIVGTFITHLRRQKISREGTKFLIRDLNEYHNIMVLFESPETIDMMLCLKEIATVYSCDPADVPKMVTEGLRHLDTAVVLALVRSRADFQAKSNAGHWTRKLTMAYGPIKWEAPLPWENKRNMTIISFAASAAAGMKSPTLGPPTLRKLNAPMITSILNSDGGASSSSAMNESEKLDKPSSSSFIPNRPENGPQLSANITSFEPRTYDFDEPVAQQQQTLDTSNNTGAKIKNLLNTVQDKTMTNVQKGLDVVKQSTNTLVNQAADIPINPFSNGSSDNRLSTNFKIPSSDTLKNMFAIPSSKPNSSGSTDAEPKSTSKSLMSSLFKRS